MYHHHSGVSSRIVTIQFPELRIVLDFDRLQQDRRGVSYPSITVFAELIDFDYEMYFDLFAPSLSEVIDAIVVDSWDNVMWLENKDGDEKLKDRQFLTTFVDLASVDKLAEQ